MAITAGVRWRAAAAMAASVATATVQAQPTVSLEFLAKGELTKEQVGGRWPFGGISGLTWDEEQGLFVAVSDAKDQPRAYFIQIDPAETLEGAMSPHVTQIATMKLYEAQLNPRDCEAIAPDGQGGWIVSLESPQALARYTADFQERTLLQMLPEELRRRFYPNRGVEALALLPGGGPLGEKATALAITEWGPNPADPSVQGMPRLQARGKPLAMALDPETLQTVAQGWYPLGLPTTAHGLKSLVEIAPLDASHVLALERAAASGGIFFVELYLATIEPGPDGQGFTITKEKIDLPSFPGIEKMGNIESMAIGPALPDGSGDRLLLLATDDNFGLTRFGRDHTDLLAFRLRVQRE